MNGREAMLAGLLVLAATNANAADLIGIPRVIDADTLAFGATHVRLAGIDAPELRQPCTQFDGSTWYPGKIAAAWLRSLIRGVTVDCRAIGVDRYGRTVAHCYAEGADLSRALAVSGWAIPYMDPDGRYRKEADSARARGVGMHAGRCDDPADWRHSTPTGSTTETR